MKMRHKDHINIQDMLKIQKPVLPVPAPAPPNSSQTPDEIKIDDNDNDFSKVTPLPPPPSVNKLIQNLQKETSAVTVSIVLLALAKKTREIK